MALPPACTVAAGRIVKVIPATTSPMQGARANACKLRMTLPAVLSAALGVYVGFRVVEFVKEPVPELVQ